MPLNHHGLSAAVVLMSVATGAILVAKERIFVDQWSPTRSELFIADADGRNARKLVAGLELDYNASFSFDGDWVVFTSERHGSADIFRVRANGMGLERLTDDPPSTIRPRSRRTAVAGVCVDPRYRIDRHLCPGREDPAIPKPDQLAGRRLSTELVAGRTKDRVLDPIAERSFSDRRATGNRCNRRASTWSASMAAICASSPSAMASFAGSPKWSPDGSRVVFYELAVADTFRARGLGAQATVESRIVSVDVATGARVEHASGPGLKLSPQFLDANRIGYLAKSGTRAALTFSSGEKGSEGDIGNPSWSRDGRRVVYHSGPIETIPAARRPGRLAV